MPWLATFDSYYPSAAAVNVNVNVNNVVHVCAGMALACLPICACVYVCFRTSFPRIWKRLEARDGVAATTAADCTQRYARAGQSYQPKCYCEAVMMISAATPTCHSMFRTAAGQVVRPSRLTSTSQTGTALVMARCHAMAAHIYGIPHHLHMLPCHQMRCPGHPCKVWLV